MSEPKQIILMRTDLNMPVGKMVAQGAHASMAILTNMMTREMGEGREHHYVRTLKVPSDTWVEHWLEGPFVKICLAVDSELKLIELFDEAIAAKIPAALITDAGRTIFEGKPTITCAAIGPWGPEQIDLITGHLKLL